MMTCQKRRQIEQEGDLRLSQLYDFRSSLIINCGGNRIGNAVCGQHRANGLITESEQT